MLLAQGAVIAPGDEAVATAVPAGTPVEEAEQASECVVCLEEKREMVLVPCGHACVCEGCSGTLALCPICRATIEKAVKMYAS